MAWVWWLSGPVVATVLAACWSWLRARPPKLRTTPESMTDHSAYLDALVQTARSRDKGLRSDDGTRDGTRDRTAQPSEPPERTDDAAA